jgi:hypothetical protein
MLAQTAADRPSRSGALTFFLPGVVAAVVMHSRVQHPCPCLAARHDRHCCCFVLPLLVLWVFQRSEMATARLGRRRTRLSI